MMTFLLSLCLSLSLLVSPEVQVILGNSVGLNGWMLYPLLILIGAVIFFTMEIMAKDGFCGGLGQSPSWLMLATFFGSRLVFFVTCSTIVLVTAGYVFNEVFLSSFPNFLFAFLLLGLILVVQLIGVEIARKFQVVLVLVWLACLITLVLFGFGAVPHPKSGGVASFSFAGMALPFLLLVGFELGLSFKDSQSLSPRYIVVGLIVVLALLGMWSFMMERMVSLDSLSASYIPHTKTARRLLGDPGRMLIGLAMIAGSAAMVNGVLLVLVHQCGQILGQFKSGFSHDGLPWLRWGLVLILGVLPGIMMARGMAGYDSTEVYIRASLLIWLLSYCLAHIRAMGQQGGRAVSLSVLICIILLSAMSGLIITDTETARLLEALGYTLCGAGSVAGLVYYLRFKFC